MACLDTSVLLDLIGRGGSKARGKAIELLSSLAAEGEELVATRFSVAEMFVGVWRVQDSSIERTRVNIVLETLQILDFDQKAAEVFGQITAELQRLGRPVGDMDALIAATALANGHCLVTANPSHFLDIPGLLVKSYGKSSLR